MSADDPGKVGLLLTFCFNLDENIRSFTFAVSEIEQKMVSFERCRSYMQLPPERGYVRYL